MVTKKKNTKKTTLKAKSKAKPAKPTKTASTAKTAKVPTSKGTSPLPSKSKTSASKKPTVGKAPPKKVDKAKKSGVLEASAGKKSTVRKKTDGTQKKKASPIKATHKASPKAIPKAMPKAARASVSDPIQQKLREILIQKRAVLHGDVSRLEEEACKPSSLHISVDHMADFGTDNYDQEFNLSLVESGEFTISEINEAIKRIEEGTFGICEDCDCKIPKARLEAIPYTRFCVACQAKRELS